jgi:hypothetical protein
VLFFEADAGGGQVGGTDQPDGAFPPGIGLDEGLNQMLVDPTQSPNSQAGPELVQHTHPGHLGLATQAGKPPPRKLLGQHFDQQVQGMNG